LLHAADKGRLTPVILRSGMIYRRGILMIEAARWLMRQCLLGVWRQPAWIHRLAMPDFLACVVAGVRQPAMGAIYGSGDEAPLILRRFFDPATERWGDRRRRRPLASSSIWRLA
jgi:hypothetical protein